jgi:hypothetical protein
LKFKACLAALLFAVVLMSGCAAAQVSKNIFDFSIVPDKGIKAGTIITVTVKAAEDTAQVVGFLDMIPAYRMPLKYDKAKNVWYLRQMIPMMYTLPQGKYTAKIEVTTKSGDRSYAEKEISTY